MTEERKVLVPSRRLLWIFGLYGFVFDSILARIRPVLFPFWLFTQLCDGIVEIIWRLSTEYAKRQFGYCGTGVRISRRFKVTSPIRLHVDHNVHINANAFLRAEGGLYIGENTHIGRNLVVYTMNHNYIGEQLPYDSGKILKPVHIGRNVWIGMNVTITPGVTIGDGAIIGMGTVVARDVPSLAIIGSAPQRVLKMRDEAHYKALDEASQYGGMAGYPWRSKG
jgi:chloramphenicol O-acetyltransferase type B